MFLLCGSTPNTHDDDEDKNSPRGSDELRLLLVGSTGAGKSATGNTILGSEAFESRPAAASVTRECQKGGRVWEGRHLVVVDTPGFISRKVPEEQLSSEMERCAQLSSPGPHAILLVLQAGRFTADERVAVQRIRSLFGKEALKFTVIVFTRKDDLECETIETFVRESEKKLKKLVKSCGGRFYAFHNRATGLEKEKQVGGLIQMIDSIMKSNKGKHYALNTLEETRKNPKKINVSDNSVGIVTAH